MDQPLKLVIEETDTGAKVQIVGDSELACAVEYELEVQGSGARKANRSVQRGKARLLPNQKIVVATAMIGSGRSREWNARLLVRPCNGPSYEQSASAHGSRH